jgi:hypothetical protein
MRRGRLVSWVLGGSLSIAAVALAGACSSQAPSTGGPSEETTLRVFTNGGFEMGPGNSPPQGWTVTTDLNPGVTIQTPQTLAGLGLAPAIGGHAAPTARTDTLNSPTGPLMQTDALLGLTASLRWPRYGNQCAIVNAAGKKQNVNTLAQTMTIAASDVDPVDGKVHVRFVLAPVLENPGHPANEQPYFYVQVTNVTRGNAVLYSNFNFSNQAGVPWITDNTGGTTYEYTNWQLVDVAPGSPAINLGDSIQLVVIGAGCSLGGHEGEVYVDGVGSTIPGINVSATGPAQANAGTSITYSGSYRNGSPVTACVTAANCAPVTEACVGGACAETGLVIDFTTPPNTTFQSLTPPAGATCVTPAVGTAGTIVCTFTGPVPAGSSGSFSVTVNVAAGTTGAIVLGTYSIQSTQETPLLGNAVTTIIGCTADAQCLAGNWCHETVPNDCDPTLPNGTPVPSDPGHVPALGACTPAAGALVCTSGVCDTSNNACGYRNGDGPCTTGNGGTVCDSAVCDPHDGKCGDANGDGPCNAGNGNAICRSAVCDLNDDNCGYANGDGPCTAATGAVVCRSAACSTNGTCKPAGGCNVDADCAGGDWCDESTNTCTPRLANGTRVPTDPPHTPTLNGTCSLAAGTLVCVSRVCDTADNDCGYANGDGPCTAANGSVVCRSGTCSSSGTCEPAGGCNVDADCTGGDWCNESAHTCTPQLANGTPVPTDPSHTTPTLDGMCTPAAATLVCASGVCDATNNECGYANGDGPCTVATGSVCQSGTCSPTGTVCVPVGGCAVDADCMTTQYCDTPTNTCVAKLPNSQPIPVVAGHTPTLDGTCSVVEGATVCASGVCDTKDNECGYANGDGPCTTTDGATDCRSATCSTDGTCEPAGGCNVDADCATGMWCNETAHTCTAQLANGTPVPTDTGHTSPTLNGTCTAAAGTLVCVSGVCDTKDNKCGYANGDGPCTATDGTNDCRSMTCGTSGAVAGLCVACNDNSECSGSTPICDTTTGACVECLTSATCPSDAPTCDTTNGMCTTACTTDAECSKGDWCDITSGTSGLCAPKIANGDPLPTTPSSVSVCTPAVGKRVCVSGVCDTNDNDCGPAPDAGTPDAGAPDASSGCTRDSECGSGTYCATGGACVPTLPEGDTCSRFQECQSQSCTSGVCSVVTSSGNGVFCSVRAVGATGGSENWSVVGVMLGLAGAFSRRRKQRAA